MLTVQDKIDLTKFSMDEKRLYWEQLHWVKKEYPNVGQENQERLAYYYFIKRTLDIAVYKTDVKIAEILRSCS